LRARSARNTITKKITLQHYHMSFAVFGLSPI